MDDYDSATDIVLDPATLTPEQAERWHIQMHEKRRLDDRYMVCAYGSDDTCIRAGRHMSLIHARVLCQALNSQVDEQDKSNAVTGVWLRRTGDKAEVLVEIDDTWHVVITENIHDSFSHIKEAPFTGAKYL